MSSITTFDAIEVRDRQRPLDRSHMLQLKASILSKGLLQPPVVAEDEKGRFIVAGLHRLEALREIHADGGAFFYNGIPFTPDSGIPITRVVDLLEADLMEAELEENIIRLPLTWQDKARALSAIHAKRIAANPKQSLSATAKELAAKGGAFGVTDTNYLRTEVRNANILAANLHRPSIMKARNATEAFGILMKEEQAKIERELIERRAAKAVAPASIRAIHGDLTQVIPSLDAEMFDLILADLPYGIDANTGGFRSRTVEHHNYDDTPENAQLLMQAVIAEGFRVAKPRANLFIFGDIDLFPFFKRAAASMGWKPFRTPVIWRKSESEGLAPWGSEGFRRTYEMVFYATKGKRGLLQSPVDILDESRVARHLRRYGPEKPVGLIRQLIECSTMPGDYVLDPCCGAGSTLIAARHTKRRALGIEKDESAYNLAVVAADRDPVEVPEEPKTEDLA